MPRYIAIALLVATACSLPFFTDWDESVGVVDGGMLAQGQAIQLDTVVSVGGTGRVSVITGGSGSCTRFGRTDVNWQSARVVVITPYNENLTTAQACTADFRFIPHQVSLQYSQAGTYTVRIRAELSGSVQQIAERFVRVQ